MKEEYFTLTTIREKAQEMFRAVECYRSRHSNVIFKPNQAALLVLDMQNYFLINGSHAYIPASQAIIPGIQRLLHSFKQMNRPIIFTRHMNDTESAKTMAIWWKDLIEPGSIDSQIYNALDSTSCLVIEKKQYDAFFQTNLESILHKYNIKQVVITGVMTHLCCETTARSAFMRGFEVFFLIDCTATYNEEFHTASLVNLAHGFALPMLGTEIIDGFKHNG